MIREHLRRLRRPVDRSAPENLEPAFVRQLAPWVDRACKVWYRLEVLGIDEVPPGPALIVGNHNSGVMFLEGLGVGARWIRSREEYWHALGHDQVIDAPVVGALLARVGVLRASHESAARAFAKGRKVAVFPGGNLEAFRPHKDRGRVVLGGRTGFIKLALRHQVPIVPVVFHGGHSGFYVVRDGQRLARWLGADRSLRSDTWPLWLGLPWGIALGPWPHLPLPVKCTTRFLEPISIQGYGPEAEHDEQALRTLYARVEARLQEGLDQLVQSAR